MEGSNDQDLVRIKKGLCKYSVSRYESDNSALYVLSVAKLTKLGIDSWKRNRVYDEKRVKAIRKHYKNGGVIDGIIYLAAIKDRLVCYDGNHRRLALELCDIKGSVIVDIMWLSSDEAVCDRFNLINKAISVPTLYLETKASKRKDIEELKAYKMKAIIIDYVANMCVKYEIFQSSSRHCHIPSFNRDVLIEDITDLYEDNENTIAILTAMNKAYKKELYGFDETSVSSTVRDKCKRVYGLWLFCEGRQINRAYFRKVAKKEGL